MRVADAVWAATALLHQENPKQTDFEVQEIVSRAIQENFAGGFRPGLQPHVSWHCVANKKPNGGRYRMLFETARGRRRLFHMGDIAHPDRNGDVRPDESSLPDAYKSLVDWYESVYSDKAQSLSTKESGGEQNLANHISLKTVRVASTVFVSSAGALVIPEDLRRLLRIREGTRLSIREDGGRLIIEPVNRQFVERVAGSYRGRASMVEARERDHRIER